MTVSGIQPNKIITLKFGYLRGIVKQIGLGICEDVVIGIDGFGMRFHGPLPFVLPILLLVIHDTLNFIAVT